MYLWVNADKYSLIIQFNNKIINGKDFNCIQEGF